MARPTQAPNRSRPQGTVSTSSPHSLIFCRAEVGKMRIRIGGNMRIFPLLLLLSALVFLRSVGGPDYSNYAEWAEALLRGSSVNIFRDYVSLRYASLPLGPRHRCSFRHFSPPLSAFLLCLVERPVCRSCSVPDLFTSFVGHLGCHRTTTSAQVACVLTVSGWHEFRLLLHLSSL